MNNWFESISEKYEAFVLRVVNPERAVKNGAFMCDVSLGWALALFLYQLYLECYIPVSPPWPYVTVSALAVVTIFIMRARIAIIASMHERKRISAMANRKLILNGGWLTLIVCAVSFFFSGYLGNKISFAMTGLSLAAFLFSFINLSGLLFFREIDFEHSWQNYLKSPLMRIIPAQWFEAVGDFIWDYV